MEGIYQESFERFEGKYRSRHDESTCVVRVARHVFFEVCVRVRVCVHARMRTWCMVVVFGDGGRFGV